MWKRIFEIITNPNGVEFCGHTVPHHRHGVAISMLYVWTSVKETGGVAKGHHPYCQPHSSAPVIPKNTLQISDLNMFQAIKTVLLKTQRVIKTNSRDTYLHREDLECILECFVDTVSKVLKSPDLSQW